MTEGNRGLGCGLKVEADRGGVVGTDPGPKGQMERWDDRVEGGRTGPRPGPVEGRTPEHDVGDGLRRRAAEPDEATGPVA